jgi:predicted permease
MYSSWGGCPEAPVGSSRGCSFSYPSFEQIRTQNHVFSGVLAFGQPVAPKLTANGATNVAIAEPVSGSYFATLGIQPTLGRLLSEEDERPNAPPAAVLSYGCWQRRFGGDPAVVGKAVTLNRASVTIVGVAPPEFFGLRPALAPDIWIPVTLTGLVQPMLGDMLERLRSPDDWEWNLVARLKPGVDREAVRTDLDLLFQRSLPAGANSQLKPQDLPRTELEDGSKGLAELRLQFSKPLFILMAFVALVLLIACANVTNLLLVRAAARRKEIAVRMATGAGRARLVRQLLTESILLAGLGGAFGILLAYWGVSALVALISTGFFSGLHLEVRPDLHVLGFTAAASGLTGIVCGLAPALRGTRLDLTPALKEANPTLAGARHRWLSLRNSLVVAQIALSLVLLIGAALFVRTLVNLEHVNAGFDRRNLLLFGLDGTESGYRGERLKSLYQEVQGRLATLPGVLSAGSSNTTLVGGGYGANDITIPGYPSKAGEKISARSLCVGPGFFETMGIRTLLGRTIDRRDLQTAPKVAVINQAMARRYFPGLDALGRQFTLGDSKKKEDLIEIVGVMEDAKYENLREVVEPTVYLPYLQSPVGGMHFELRTAGNPLDLAPSVRRVVQSLDKGLPLTEMKTQAEQIDQSLFQERLFARLSTLFGLLALLLACVGIYGVMAYAVRARTNEIGIRLALGAGRSSVLSLFVSEALFLAALGIVFGVAGALALTRAFSGVLESARPTSSLLYGLRANDPATFVVVSLALAAVVLLACFVPARRATKVDPMVALRYE